MYGGFNLRCPHDDELLLAMFNMCYPGAIQAACEAGGIVFRQGFPKLAGRPRGSTAIAGLRARGSVPMRSHGRAGILVQGSQSHGRRS